MKISKEVTRTELVQLWGVFEGLLTKTREERLSVRFIHMLNVNKKSIEPEVTSIQMAIQEFHKQPLSEKIQAYEAARLAVCNEYCEKDEEGKPIMISVPDSNGSVNNTYQFKPELQKEVVDKIAEIRSEHLEAANEIEARRTEIDSFMASTVEIQLYTVKLADMPETMLGIETQLLFDIIEEE